MVIKLRSFNQFWFQIAESLFKFANFAFVLASFLSQSHRELLQVYFFYLDEIKFCAFHSVLIK
ncbi:unnamed protein product [Brassica rapa]|uniref:Uncharacterized protein n=2 Tax=Brassica TaxID=3705 RepID=A0A8D9CUV2_BRACM|nr:unnamed protein product [Brassica napus]CAG7864111.1 unnamed protein product [Brassica rapa]